MDIKTPVLAVIKVNGINKFNQKTREAISKWFYEAAKYFSENLNETSPSEITFEYVIGSKKNAIADQIKSNKAKKAEILAKIDEKTNKSKVVAKKGKK